jgi:hypothetical protein
MRPSHIEEGVSIELKIPMHVSYGEESLFDFKEDGNVTNGNDFKW